MSENDCYEYEKANMLQEEMSSPYADKQWSYIADNSQGSYQSGLSLVEFSSQKLFANKSLVELDSLFISIPEVKVMAFCDSSNTLIAPTAESINYSSKYLLADKEGGWSNLHQVQIEVNGQQVSQTVPYLNVLTSVQTIPRLCEGDVKNIGSVCGFAGLSNAYDVTYCGTGSTCLGGSGMKNNDIFPVTRTTGAFPLPAVSLSAGVSIPGPEGQNSFGIESTNVTNPALVKRCNTYTSAATAASTTVLTNYGSAGATLNVGGVTQLNNEITNVFLGVQATYYLVWTSTRIVRLRDISDFFNKSGLVACPNFSIRLYVNTGCTAIKYLPASAGVGGPTMYMNGSDSNFGGSCPFMVNNLCAFWPLTAGQTVAGQAICGSYIGRALQTSLYGVNLANSSALGQTQSARLYFPLCKLKAREQISYFTSQRAKKVVYESALYNLASAITSGSNYSQIIQSSVRRPKRLILIPLVGASVNGLNTTAPAVTSAFSCTLSPFLDNAITGPLSLTNVNVTVSGLNTLQQPLTYGFENWLEQGSLVKKINGSDSALTNSVYGFDDFVKARRWYTVELGRGEEMDDLALKSITCTFTNNSNLTIDCLIYTIYEQVGILNCETSDLQII